MARKSIISFKCGASTLEPIFMHENDCNYYFEWTTEQACVYDCGIQYKNQLFDLSVLTKYNGHYWPVVNGMIDKNIEFSNIILNVCDKLNLNEKNSVNIEQEGSEYKAMLEKCSRDASICAYDKIKGKVRNLGTFLSDPIMSQKNEGTDNLRLVKIFSWRSDNYIIPIILI